MISTELALSLVQRERARQVEKWGEHQFEKQGKLFALAVLMEEVGEAAQDTLEHRDYNFIDEMIQVAAVAVAAIEDFSGLAAVQPEAPPPRIAALPCPRCGLSDTHFLAGQGYDAWWCNRCNTTVADKNGVAL